MKLPAKRRVAAASGDGHIRLTEQDVPALTSGAVFVEVPLEISSADGRYHASIRCTFTAECGVLELRTLGGIAVVDRLEVYGPEPIWKGREGSPDP